MEDHRSRVFATKTRTSRSGFTLVEILVASGMMAVLVLAVLLLSTRMLESWNASANDLALRTQARLILDTVQRDLEAMIVRQGTSGAGQSLAAEVPTEGENTVFLRFLAALGNPSPPPDAEVDSLEYREPLGDVSAVAYMVERNNPIRHDLERNEQGVLYRARIDPVSTLRNGFLAELDSKSVEDFLTSNQNDEDGKIHYDNAVLATGVERFDVTFGVGGLNDAGEATLNETRLPPALQLNLEDDEEILWIEVSVTLLSPEGVELMQLLDEPGNLLGEVTEEDILAEHAQTFSRRISLPMARR